MKQKSSSSELTKGVIYARYSSSGQRDESIEGQLRECREFAQRYGIVIVGEYCDRAITGTSDKRPEFQRMMRDSTKGQFSVVVTWKNDRFARSRYDSAIYKSKLKQQGIRILYAKEAIPDGPEGIILESVMEGFAEYYSANLSQNVKRGNHDSALKLQTVGQKVFGLRKGAEKRFEIDPQTAPIVKRIFNEYVSGRPALDIYTDLNNEGYRTVHNNLFNKNSLRRILKNEKYIGVYEYSGVRVENGIPAIIDNDLFQRAQRMVNIHHRAPSSKKVDGGFLLTAKLFCGECQEPMTGDGGTSANGNVYSYYICNGRRKKKCKKERVQKQWIEDLVINALANIVNSDDMINEFVDRFMDWQSKQNNKSEIAGLEKRLRETETAIKNTMSLVDSGFITDSLKSHLIELESTRVQIEQGIAKEQIEAPTLERESVQWFLQQFRGGDQNDAAWRIFIVETFLRAAYLYDDGRLLLHLNFGGNKNKVTLETIENTVQSGEAFCSSFAPTGAPLHDKFHFGICRVFLFVV